ncbi:MAG: TIGR04168 family protein [Cyanosarcina radialis HA8281-LM2]|jgi:uncharacterized protein (TIGR04168 family)|nr:TIGR04168 family protein [Cyanosarcina radialis HA8281-LM2]
MESQLDRQPAIEIAVVGDVHEQWEEDDGIALKHLGVDLVLFVGDFGNESVEVVSAIASLDLPKAVILGNHDAWYTATDWGRSKCPYNRQQEDWVQEQLDLLGKCHVGYSHLDFPELNLTVVGGRPFSWGGSDWRYGDFYQQRLGASSFTESADRIVSAALESTYATTIFLGHNGPLGLGDRAEDPCGKDWGNPIGGDFGDPDLKEAIDRTRLAGKTIPLVAFGHMHHHLRHTKERLRTPTYVDAAGTFYLNAASVPRILPVKGDRWRNFSLVSLQTGVVTQASLVWLDRQFQIASEEVFYRRKEFRSLEV